MGALTAWIGTRMWAVARAQAGVPMWDEAAHGLAGVEIAEALRLLDLFGFLRALNAQALWPFVHSLMLAPAFLARGIGVPSAELTSLVLYVATIALFVVAGASLHPTRGVWIGIVAAALALASPSWRVYGSLAFLEMPGAFLLTLAFLLHARSSEEPASGARLRAAAWAATALFLCKYNYGALWLLAVAWWEWEGAGELDRARLLGLLRPWRSPRAWLRPVPLLLVAGVLAIAAILVTGGGAFTVLGQRVSARSPGNLPYALWLVLLVWLFVPRRGRPSRAGAVWAGLSSRARTLTLGTLLPLAIWFTLPGHLRELVGFGANRDSGVPLWSLKAVLFYPRVLAFEHSAVAWVGWLALALAIWPAHRERRAARLAWLGFAVAFVATMVHRYRDARFLFTVCPLLWLCASDRAAWLVSRGLAYLRPPALRGAAWTLSALALLSAAGWSAAHDRGWIERRAALRSPVDVLPALDAVLEQVDPASVDAVLAERIPLPGGRVAFRNAPPRVAMLGYANELSPGLLGWHARIVRPDLAPARLPKRVPTDAGLGWLDTHADVVVAVLADSGSADYLREVAPDRALVARLESGEDGWSERANARVGRFRISRFVRGR